MKQDISSITKILNNYLPKASINYLAEWINNNNVRVVITKGRKTKLGDFKYTVLGDKKPQISFNGDMNAEQTLITFCHEIAHYNVYKNYKNVKPHGVEWKNEYKKIMGFFLNEDCFKKEVLEELTDFMQNPKASFGAHTGLAKILQKNDKKDGEFFLDELNINDKFIYRNTTFIYKNKRQKRILCKCLDSHKQYLFNPITKIKKAI